MSEIELHGAVDALTLREQTAAKRAEIERQTIELRKQQQRAKDEIEQKKAELEAELRRRTTELEQQMAPLAQRLKQMQEVLWTVNLYLGRDEQLSMLRGGKPAPVTTPITIRQKVLVMAEEALMLGLDFREIGTFTEWLLASPEHLDRVLPEPKGCVVLVPTKVKAESGNIFEDMARNQANSQSYWLFRNGERLYLLTVDPELTIGERLLPRRREFVEVFDRGLFGYGRASGEPLRPGSEEWMQLEKIADARRRHYMRIMMVLQGIVDRTEVWQPAPPGLSLLTVEAQDRGLVRLIQDDEASIQLGDGLEPFAKYQQRLNALLRPGLRVIGNWHGYKDDADDRYRIWPERAQGLDPHHPYTIEDRRDGGYVIRFTRTDQVLKRNQPVPGRPGYVYRGETFAEPSKRASYLLKATDSWVLPYDLVTVPELERYLASREERSKHFLSMVPTIRAALRAKQMEAEQEAPFRVLLRGLLLNEGADPETVDAMLDELVHWWKLKHTWCRPLNGDAKHEGEAAREIVREYLSRQTLEAEADVAAQMIAAGQKVEGVICIAKNRQGEWHAYSPSQPAPLGEHVYLDITRIKRNGELGTTKRWKMLTQRGVSALQVAWHDEPWDSWLFGAHSAHWITAEEREGLVAKVLNHADGMPLCVLEYHDPTNPKLRAFALYEWRGAPPEQREAVADADPLNWRSAGDPVAMRSWVIEHGAHLGRERNPRTGDWRGQAFQTAFSAYSGGSKYGKTPWSDDAARPGSPRPRLVWSDSEALDRMNDWRLRCLDAHREKQRNAQELEEAAYRYVRPIQALIRSRVLAEERGRFLEDYGTDAEDLWEMRARKSASPIHNRTLWGLVAGRLERGEAVAGLSLGELAEASAERNNTAPGEWHPEPGRQDLCGFDDVIVPEPEPEEISGFQGEYRFLSNFWECPVILRDVEAPTAEHHYQAAKALYLSDAERVLQCESPGQAKRLGAKIAIRPDWEEVRISTMEEIVKAKFQDRELAERLFSTGRARLVEANHWHDTFWGVCDCEEHAGEGENQLGAILMRVRSGLSRGV